MTPPLYVHTCFENASPLLWEEPEEGLLVFQPLYDHERGSRNRQLTHWHFRLCGTAGQTVRLRVPPSINIYGGRPGDAFKGGVANQMSADGENWTPIVFENKDDGSIETKIEMPADEVTIARVQPYTTRHLDEFVSRIESESAVRIETIGRTVENRPLDMITLSRGTTPKPSILIRARSHPWEPGGNWFIEGLTMRALSTASILDTIDIHVLPMAAKDGVVHGHTRYNVNGYDLNRGFGPDATFDEEAVPENFALIRWVEARRDEGALPRFAMDLHNDSWGNLHVGDMESDAGYATRIRRLDALLREGSYYTEGMTTGAGNATFGGGLRAMFDIDAIVWELNANWLAGANAVPHAGHWRDYGAQAADVLRDFAAEFYP